METACRRQECVVRRSKPGPDLQYFHDHDNRTPTIRIESGILCKMLARMSPLGFLD